MSTLVRKLRYSYTYSQGEGQYTTLGRPQGLYTSTSRRHYRIIPTQEPSPNNAWRATPWLKAQMYHPMTGRRKLCLCKLYGLPQKCVCGDCSPLSLCEQAPIGKHSETERMQTTPTTTAWPMRRTKAGGTAYKQKYEHKKHQE